MPAFAQGNATTVRVLMVVENTGYPRDSRVRKEAEALTKAGHAVAVISPAYPGQRWHQEIAGVHVYRYPAPPAANGAFGYVVEYAYSMAAIFALSLWVVTRHGFDVFHAANPPDTLVFVAAFYKMFGKRFVFDHHDLAPEMYDARFAGRGNRHVRRILLWCEKVSCRLADHVVATNQSSANVDMERHGIPAQRITIVRNGPELNRMRPCEIDESLRQRAGTILAYAGVMGFQDGVDLLLQAVRRLVYDLRRTDVLCILLGDGDAAKSLKASIAELELENYVRFCGWIEDQSVYARYLSTADICVDPSPSTPYNDHCTAIKLTEYMAVQKPMVVFDLPEHRVTAGEAALYAKPSDPLEFARAIAALMDDPGQRARLGSIGRCRIESHLSWDHSVPKLLDAYQSVLGLPQINAASTATQRPSDGSYER